MVKKVERKGKQMVVNRGAWTAEEDKRLMDHVRRHGDKKWRTLPSKAGLNRCGKSCRLRWLNYLRPGIKRGNISEEEEDLIIRLHNLLGNRWSLIAARLPGRTDNEIKNHWNTHLSKKSLTIEDLNLKLNQQFDGANLNIQQHGNNPCESTPDPIDCSLGWVSDTSLVAIDSSTGLLDLDFDFDQLSDFMAMPAIDHNDAKSNGSYSYELGVENHNSIVEDGCKTSWNNDQFVSVSNTPEFGTLDQIVSYQDFAVFLFD